MKKSMYIILILIYCISSISFGQSDVTTNENNLTNEQEKNNRKENDKSKLDFSDLPDNDVLLKDRLDEIKEEISESEDKAKGFKSYLADLKSYKDKLSRTDIEKTKKLIETLLILLESDPKNKIQGLAKQLYSAYSKLYFESISFFYKNADVNEHSRTFINNNESKIEMSIPIDLVSKLDNSNSFEQTSKISLTIEDKQDLERLRDDLNQKSNIFNSLTEATASEITSMTVKENEAKEELNKLKSVRAKIIEMLNEKDTAIDSLAITLGLPLFCATILLLFLGPSILRLFAKESVVNSFTGGYSNSLLEISTVLLLTMSILILALARQLESQVLGTLIGGISGYVLNRVSSNKNSNQS